MKQHMSNGRIVTITTIVQSYKSIWSFLECDVLSLALATNRNCAGNVMASDGCGGIATTLP